MSYVNINSVNLDDLDEQYLIYSPSCLQAESVQTYNRILVSTSLNFSIPQCFITCLYCCPLLPLQDFYLLEMCCINIIFPEDTHQSVMLEFI